MYRIFSEGSFAGYMRAGDSRRFKVDLKNDRKTVLEAAAKAATTGPATFTNYFHAFIKRRACLSLKDYSQNLILRSVSRYIARRFRVKTRNRDSIVREIIESLGDSTPMYIIRRDIKSFYESLPHEKARQKILHDTFLPIRIKLFIASFFSTFCGTTYGVPRGIGLSSIVAELAMQTADKRIREIPGVYKYFRYSDDILIFSFRPPQEISSPIEQQLPPGLKLNKEKSSDTIVNCSKKELTTQRNFEYLGYRFTFNDYCGDKGPRKVTVGICDRKISKLKSRIICSLKSYEKTKNYNLLLDRIRFISSNYHVLRKGAATVKSSKYVKSGIYYNYQLCGTYQGAERNPHSGNELKALDAFYNSLLSGPSSTFSKNFSLPIQAHRLAKLKEISFYKGFSKKMMVRLQPDRVQEIKGLWRNA